MEKKKISASAIILFVAIVVMVIMLSVVFALNKEREVFAEKIVTLNSEISNLKEDKANLENTIEKLQGKINSISGIITDEEKDKENIVEENTVVTNDKENQNVVTNEV